jgi:hypothetical protein
MVLPLHRDIQPPITPIVNPKMNTGKEFPSVSAPVFTALRRGKSLRRDKSACIRFHVISARQV